MFQGKEELKKTNSNWSPTAGISIHILKLFILSEVWKQSKKRGTFWRLDFGTKVLKEIYDYFSHTVKNN